MPKKVITLQSFVSSIRLTLLSDARDVSFLNLEITALASILLWQYEAHHHLSTISMLAIYAQLKTEGMIVAQFATAGCTPMLLVLQEMYEGSFSPYRVYMQNVLSQKCGTQVVYLATF